MLSVVEEGCTVVFHYTGILADGRIFGCSREGSPMEVEIGCGSVIPGFEGGLIGMHVGESRTFTLSPKDGYGEFDEDLCQWVDISRFAAPGSVEVGMHLRVPLEEGQTFSGTVVQVGKDYVLMDFNHPLAGKDLSFWVDCLDIRDE